MSKEQLLEQLMEQYSKKLLFPTPGSVRMFMNDQSIKNRKKATQQVREKLSTYECYELERILRDGWSDLALISDAINNFRRNK